MCVRLCISQKMTTISYIGTTNRTTNRDNNNVLSLHNNNKKRFSHDQHHHHQHQHMPNPVDIFLGKTNFAFTHTKPVPIRRSLDEDNLLANFKLFLIFGKFIGLVPIQGLFQSNPHELKFRKTSCPSLINLVIWAMLAVNAFAGVIALGRASAKNAGEYAWAPTLLSFYGNGLFLYVFFYRRSERIIEIFKKWNSMQLEFTQPDLKLYRDVNLIAGCILTSAILENAFGHLKLFPLVQYSEAIAKNNRESVNSTALEIYYYRSHGAWADIAGYSPGMAIYVFISNKLAVYAWNYMDIIIAIFARALYFKFKALYVQGDAMLFKKDPHAQYDTTKWRQLTTDHETLVNMVMEIGALLSPLVFTSYALNIYYICLQLHLGLTPAANTSTIASVYAVWSFLHLVARVYVVSICGARSNDWAHKVKDLFRKCPNEAYITEVERTERFVSVNQIGFTGLGCFIVTKPLLLQVLGVVFTFEIVLLQASQTPLEMPASGSNGVNLCKKS